MVHRMVLLEPRLDIAEIDAVAEALFVAFCVVVVHLPFSDPLPAMSELVLLPIFQRVVLQEEADGKILSMQRMITGIVLPTCSGEVDARAAD